MLLLKYIKTKGANMNRLTINGLDVQTYGKDTNQSIVFIHGFPFDHTLWDGVIDQLKDNYFCITYDIRGFGKSECTTGQYTMESYVEDLENIISKLKLHKPILCGFSMGGYILLRANEKQPKNYKALILANTMTSSDTDEAKLKRANAILDIDSKGLEPFLDGFLSVAFSEDYLKNKPEKLKELKNKIMSFDPLGIKGALLAMISRTDTTKSLPKIDIPVLLISAKNDKVISIDIINQMAENIKNSTHVSIQNSGHASMIEQPEQFMKGLKTFLNSLQ